MLLFPRQHQVLESAMCGNGVLFHATEENRGGGVGRRGAAQARLVKGPRRGREAGWWWGPDGTEPRTEGAAIPAVPQRERGRLPQRQRQGLRGRGRAGAAGGRRRLSLSASLPPGLFPPPPAAAGSARFFPLISCRVYSRSWQHRLGSGCRCRQLSALPAHPGRSCRGGTWPFPRAGSVAPEPAVETPPPLRAPELGLQGRAAPKASLSWEPGLRRGDRGRCWLALRRRGLLPC